MNFDEATAARLKADQKRFMERQSERLRGIGVQPGFTVSPTHMRVFAVRSYDERNEPDIVYGEWSVAEQEDQIVVTRIEYGYLKSANSA